MVVVHIFGRGAFGRRKTKRSARRRKSTAAARHKTVIHKNNNGNKYPDLPVAGSSAVVNMDGTAHMVHPTAVRANIPFKRKVNEVKKAATKAKRAAQTTLGRQSRKKSTNLKTDGRPNRVSVSTQAVGHHVSRKKSTNDRKSINYNRNSLPNNTVLDCVDPAVDTVATHANGTTTVHAATIVTIPSKSNVKPKRKESNPNKFSITNLKLRPKSLSPDKYKISIKPKNTDIKRSKSRSKTLDAEARTSDKKPAIKPKIIPAKTSHGKIVPAVSPTKKLKTEKEISKNAQRKSSRNHGNANKRLPFIRINSRDDNSDLKNENWIIQKFLNDEHLIPKPAGTGSLYSSMNDLVNDSPNASPDLSYTRHGSSKALLQENTIHSSPLQGISNDSFIASPRGSRMHTSLRVMKSNSPEYEDIPFGSSKYRRSVSMEQYKRNLAASSPEKRKRSELEQREDKKRRYTSPAGQARPSNPLRTYEFGENCISSLSPNYSQSVSRTGSKSSRSSNSTNGDRTNKEKMSVVTGTTGGSVASILELNEATCSLNLGEASSQSSYKPDFVNDIFGLNELAQSPDKSSDADTSASLNISNSNDNSISSADKVESSNPISSSSKSNSASKSSSYPSSKTTFDSPTTSDEKLASSDKASIQNKSSVEEEDLICLVEDNGILPHDVAANNSIVVNENIESMKPTSESNGSMSMINIESPDINPQVIKQPTSDSNKIGIGFSPFKRLKKQLISNKQRTNDKSTPS